MKLSELIKFFLKNYTQNVVEELVPGHPKNLKIGDIFGLTVWNFIWFVFIVCPCQRLPKYMEVKVLTSCFSLIYSCLKKQNEIWNLSLPHFLYNIWRKTFLTLYFINWPNLIGWLFLLIEVLGNICIVIICFQYYDVINFEINLSSRIDPFSYMTKNDRTKTILCSINIEHCYKKK